MGERSFLVSCDLTAEQYALHTSARAAYTQAGGVLDPYSDAFLLRFCIGNKWNEKKVTTQLRKTAEWRAKVGADRYRSAFIAGKKMGAYPEVAKFLRCLAILPNLGESKKGEPVDWASFAALDIDKSFEILTDEENFEANLIYMEYVLHMYDVRSMDRCDGQLVKGFSITDLEGMSWKMLGWRAMKRAAQTSPLLDLYYPELYAQIACINVPGWWTVLMAAFKPFFSQETLDGIKVYQRGEESALTSLIDPALVPACYGGSLEQLPQELMAEMGFDLLTKEQFDAILPGPPAHVIARGIHTLPRRVDLTEI